MFGPVFDGRAQTSAVLNKELQTGPRMEVVAQYLGASNLNKVQAALSSTHKVLKLASTLSIQSEVTLAGVQRHLEHRQRNARPRHSASAANLWSEGESALKAHENEPTAVPSCHGRR